MQLPWSCYVTSAVLIVRMKSAIKRCRDGRTLLLRRVFERLIDGVTRKVAIGTKRHMCGLRFVPFWARYLLASNQA